MSSRRKGFTLVELLVVVGVITVLIAILLPVLAGAREHANRIKCLATLRSMGQAAQMHAMEHGGYMPLAGMLPRGAWPEVVGDAAMKKYTYYKGVASGEPRSPFMAAGLTGSLGQYMGLPVKLGDVAEFQESLRSELVYRHFTCASEPEPGYGSTIGIESWRGPEERMSYMYNMRVLGQMVLGGRPGLGGNVSRVRGPERVCLFIDGQGGRPPPRAWALFGVAGEDTLYDYWRVQGHPGGAFGSLDRRRHNNRINVLYVDGHGETLMLPAYSDQGNINDAPLTSDISRVGVALGVDK
jgi:prepilin-type N-terminal cleavage/methylation domain-containing protein/prepilin-type processing-associated H-X9-DG protein